MQDATWLTIHDYIGSSAISKWAKNEKIWMLGGRAPRVPPGSATESKYVKCMLDKSCIFFWIINCCRTTNLIDSIAFSLSFGDHYYISLLIIGNAIPFCLLNWFTEQFCCFSRHLVQMLRSHQGKAKNKCDVTWMDMSKLHRVIHTQVKAKVISLKWVTKPF